MAASLHFCYLLFYSSGFYNKEKLKPVLLLYVTIFWLDILLHK